MNELPKTCAFLSMQINNWLVLVWEHDVQTSVLPLQCLDLELRRRFLNSPGPNVLVQDVVYPHVLDFDLHVPGHVLLQEFDGVRFVASEPLEKDSEYSQRPTHIGLVARVVEVAGRPSRVRRRGHTGATAEAISKTMVQSSSNQPGNSCGCLSGQ